MGSREDLIKEKKKFDQDKATINQKRESLAEEKEVLEKQRAEFEAEKLGLEEQKRDAESNTTIEAAPQSLRQAIEGHIVVLTSYLERSDFAEMKGGDSPDPISVAHSKIKSALVSLSAAKDRIQ